MRRWTVLLGLGVTAALAAACGGGGLTAPPPCCGNGTGGIVAFIVTAQGGADSVGIPPGQHEQLYGTAYDGAGEMLALAGDTTWSSRDTTIATVDAHGVVTAVAQGSTFVYGAFTLKNSQSTYLDSILIDVLIRQ